MKKLYILLVLLAATPITFAQIEGTWKLADTPSALAVGPNQGDGSWWFNTAADLVTRACLFDDSIHFDNSGGMVHYMDGDTWLEPWQGVASEQCGTPVAPHDGTTNAPYTYSYDASAGELTVNGIGAHIGLPKATNTGEITSPSDAPASTTYLVSFSNNDNTMTADINYGNGWWRFIYNKTNAAPAPTPNVTFRVDMSEYSGSTTNGVFVNGGFNGWCGNCNPMTDVGNNIWEVELPLPAGTIQYKFTVDGWTDQETIDSLSSCVDNSNDGFFNRELSFSADTVLTAVCWSSCDACLGANSIDELDANAISIYPNPATSVASVSSEEIIESITILDVNGKVVRTLSGGSTKVNMDISDLNNGVYLIQAHTSTETSISRLVKK